MHLETRYFDDVSVGMEIPQLVKGPMTTLHIMRWSSAMENWHRIHYDQRFAKEVDKLPDVLVNGSWKQQVFIQLIKDFVGQRGWLWKIRFEFREMDPVGNTIIACGRVREAVEHDGLGYVLFDIDIKNQNDKVTSSGGAVGVLPVRGGKPVPYPFVPPEKIPVTWP